MKVSVFNHAYSFFRCFSKKKLVKLINDTEDSIWKETKIRDDYDVIGVELVEFKKLGLFSYLAVWKIHRLLKIADVDNE